ncbi:LysM peptidoglycan-binding domain-containing protein [Saccharibacillus sp. CPCC 101409]|uniref:LysM peptidoglycan-binding domain-containing protein n=1 Tax=Saccharibacillus sp. CPCC 101409 TaxID=3058041 RepID=UPI002670E3F9|nr:LysM peptidoglycan-binding domain-containing protein [Saccharibacillus sp. CPCC 101409]MDO3408552.1 LysM peptidoglycan-binding domain-containing protein [Saccharibacillus sp. CPCC 101409]
MDIYLFYGKKKSFRFPVNPEEIHFSRSKGYETVNMLQHGEFDFAQGDKIKEITFSSFFPKEYDPSYCRFRKIPDPMAAVNVLNRFLVSAEPIRLVISHTGINVPVYLITYNSSFRGGEPGDIYFELTFRTWRDAKLQAKSSAGGKAGKTRTDLKTTSKTYVVKSGDSLSKIAKLELGSSAKWNDIYSLNKSVIGGNPNSIKPGQKLVMPS